jgi:hypothetical protein
MSNLTRVVLIVPLLVLLSDDPCPGRAADVMGADSAAAADEFAG